MKELSPAARSVFESFNSKFNWIEDGVPGPQFSAIAAALRAAADQVVPDDLELSKRSGEAVRLNRLSICRQIHAIADELEAS